MKLLKLVQYGFVLLVSAFALWGCPKNATVTASPEASNTETSAASRANPETQAETTAEGKGEPAERASSAAAGLHPIYFDFDKSFLREDALRVMRANIDWLKANPTVKVRIEGNCDERGTKEYNQALGQRRAANAKKFLTDAGLSARRITLISYGKERLVCGDSSEVCMQKNRRDDFVAVGE